MIIFFNKSTMMKKYFFLSIISLFIGFINISPHLFFIFKKDYKGIFLLLSDDETYYASRVREVYDRHYKISNPPFFEHKNLPFMQSPLPELILGFTGKLLNLNIDKVFIIGDFIFPAMITFFLSLLIYRFTASYFYSILGALFTIFISNIDLNRPVVPQLSLFVFLIALNLYCISVVKRGWNILSILASITAGALVYIHPHYFVFFIIYLFVSFLIFLIRKDKLSTVSSFRILFLTTIISLSYLYFLIKAQNCIYFKDTSVAVGLIKSYTPSIEGTFYSIIGLIITFIGQKFFNIKKSILITLYSFFITGFIATNQHCITGFYLYSWKFLTFIFLGLSFLVIIFFANLKKRTIKLLFLIISLYVAQKDIYVFYKKTIEVAKRFIYYQELVPVFAWINKNIKKDDVILAGDKLSSFLLIYTHCNVYSSPYPQHYFLLPKDEHIDRLLRTFYFYKFPIHRIEDYIKSHHRYFFGDKYIHIYQRRYNRILFKSYLGFQTKELYNLLPYDPKEVKKLVNIYKSFQGKNLAEIISKYKIDYVIFSPYEKGQFFSIGINDYSFLEKIYQYKDIYLYSFKYTVPNKSKDPSP